jgi:hypothetical protein
MLALRLATRPVLMTRALSTTIAYNGGDGKTLRSTIEKGNPFWLDHQRTAKEGFHGHINQERSISIALLGLWICCASSWQRYIQCQCRVFLMVQYELL